MSLFKQLVSLRDNLGGIVSDQVDWMNALCSTDQSNNAYVSTIGEYSLHINNDDLEVYDGDNQLVDSVSRAEVSNLQTKIQGLDYTFADLVDKVGASTDSYQFMSDMIARFSYSNRVSYSDICEYLNNYQNAETQQIRENLFSVTNDDGYVSRTSFLAVLDNWISSGKSAADSEEFEVDKTNPYGLQAVMSIITAATSAAISAICMLLGSIFGVIGMLIGGLISAIAQISSQVYEASQFKYDYDAGNTYIKGPICAIDNMADWIVRASDEQKKHVNLTEQNGLAAFTWFSKRDNTYKMNGYFYPHFKYQVINQLKSLGWITYDTGYYNLSVGNPQNFLHMNQNPGFASVDYYYKNGESPLTANEAIASLAIGYFIQCLIVGAQKESYMGRTAYSYYLKSIAPGTPPHWYSMSDKRSVALYWASIIVANIYVIGDLSGMDTLESLYSTLTNFANALGEICSDYFLPHRGNFLCEAALPASISYEITYSDGTAFPVFRTPLAIADQTFKYNSSADDFIWSIIGSANDNVYADCLPISWGISLPSFNMGDLASMLITVALAVTATAIAASTIKRAIVKRSYSKRAIRASELNQLREEMLADPTNAAKRKAFNNLAYKYDKLGKWFGWGSYDAANGWVDGAVASNSNTMSVLTDIRAKLGASNSTTDTDIQSLIQAVKLLIKA